MDNLITSTFGCATNAEKRNSYALARNDAEWREAYWAGGFSKNGYNRQGIAQFKTKLSTNIDNAIIFPSKTAAHRAATADERLQYCRVVPVLAKDYVDGFRSRWWVGREPKR